MRMSFWIRNEGVGGWGGEGKEIEGELWAREGREGGCLETLCFYPTVKLFVLNEAKRR